MQTRILDRGSIVLVMAIAMIASLTAYAETGLRATAARIRVAKAATLRSGSRPVLRGVITDRVLHHDWAILGDPEHPERPPQMVQVAQEGHAVQSAMNSAVPTLPKFTQQAVASQTALPLDAVVVPPSGRRPVLRAVIQATAPGPLLVRAGDRVHLWSASTNVRLEIEAIALDYGRAGQVIHLRRLGGEANRRVLLTGVVDGAGSAELLP